MTVSEEIAADLQKVEAENPQTVTWQGTDYPCLTGSARREKNLGAGGFNLTNDLVILIRSNLLPATGPALKQTLIHNGRTYRIDSLVYPSGTPFLKIIANDPNNGV